VKTENLDLGFLSAILPDGYGYKRVIKDSFNFVKGIVDDDNASQEEKAIKEVLSDVFVIRNDVLKKYISFIKEYNNEYDFLDIIKILSNEGLKIKSYIVSNPVDITSCNDNLKLSMLEQYLQRKINVNLLKKGIYIENPFMQTIVSIDSFIEPGVKIYNNCKIINSVIKAGATIKDNSIIINSQVGASIISNSVIEDSIIGDNVTIGPYAHIRLNSNIGNNCRIGNYVEIKNSLLGDSTKCAHLTYIGDANVGSNCNFGCGTVTVNYDGINKNKTVIGNNVFIGCNANLIAPIEIKDNAFIAAGSNITDNLDIDDFAIARARQVTKKGYSKKYKR
jgi:bifunctional UDP-N-acetylglucosamine pyrophosphorylase/glucosamine-1-phosphate N-acetyltransferase